MAVTLVTGTNETQASGLSGSTGPVPNETKTLVVADGDVIVLFCMLPGTNLTPTITQISGPTTLTAVHPVSSLTPTNSVHVYYWLVGTGAGGTYTMKIADGSGSANVGCPYAWLVVRGADATTPVVSGDYGAQHVAAGTTHSITAVTPASGHGTAYVFLFDGACPGGGGSPPFSGTGGAQISGTGWTNSPDASANTVISGATADNSITTGYCTVASGSSSNTATVGLNASLAGGVGWIAFRAAAGGSNTNVVGDGASNGADHFDVPHYGSMQTSFSSFSYDTAIGISAPHMTMHAPGVQVATARMPLPGITFAAAGTRAHAGSGTASMPLPGITLDAAGQRTGFGTASMPLPSITFAATGASTANHTGIASMPLPGITLDAAGESYANIAGVAAMPLGPFTFAATGQKFSHRTGVASLSLPGITLAATGQGPHASMPLGPLTFGATGTRTTYGVASLSLPGITFAANLPPAGPELVIDRISAPRLRWRFTMEPAVIAISKLTDEYVEVTSEGPMDPTGADVSFAFTQGDDEPTVWITGEWGGEATQVASNLYQAPAMGRPGTLDEGVWRIWVKLDATNGETPVRPVGYVKVGP